MDKNIYGNEDYYFGHCGVEGHEPMGINIGKANYICCHDCKVYWIVGGNLFSGWKLESEELWKKNAELLETYELLTENADLPEGFPPPVRDFKHEEKIIKYLKEKTDGQRDSVEDPS